MFNVIEFIGDKNIMKLGNVITWHKINIVYVQRRVALQWSESVWLTSPPTPPYFIIILFGPVWRNTQAVILHNVSTYSLVNYYYDVIENEQIFTTLWITVVENKSINASRLSNKKRNFISRNRWRHWRGLIICLVRRSRSFTRTDKRQYIFRDVKVNSNTVWIRKCCQLINNKNRY